jgi:hypothetical protein
MTLIHQSSPQDSLMEYISFENLQEQEVYLIKINRDENLSYGNYKVKTNKGPNLCPATYNLSCGELVKNGRFDFTRITPSNLSPVHNFYLDEVCEWSNASFSPDLVWDATNNLKYAKMWVDFDNYNRITITKHSSGRNDPR